MGFNPLYPLKPRLPQESYYENINFFVSDYIARQKRSEGLLKVLRQQGENHRVIGGDLSEMAIREGLDVSWSSYLSELPENVLDFVIDASNHKLPVRKCKSCNKGRQLIRVLQSCLPGLVAERHDKVLSYILNEADMQSAELYADIQGMRTLEGNTIPSVTKNGISINLSHNSKRLKPDIVIIEENKIYIFEISVPFECNIERRHEEKEGKYRAICRDILEDTRPRLGCELHCIEVGARGFLTRRNRSRLTFLYQLTRRGGTAGLREFINRISALACMASFDIYQRHQRSEL